MTKKSVVSHEDAQKQRKINEEAKNELFNQPIFTNDDVLMQEMEQVAEQLEMTNNGYITNQKIKAKQKELEEKKELARRQAQQLHQQQSQPKIHEDKSKDKGGLEL